MNKETRIFIIGLIFSITGIFALSNLLSDVMDGVQKIDTITIIRFIGYTYFSVNGITKIRKTI